MYVYAFAQIRNEIIGIVIWKANHVSYCNNVTGLKVANVNWISVMNDVK